MGACPCVLRDGRRTHYERRRILLLQTPTFAELGLSAKVLAAIEAAGYSEPTPIQAQAIPVAVTGQDVLGIAQTGTGKTAGFVLPMLVRLEAGRARARMPRSLILAPTRELADQVAHSFKKYGVNHRLTVALLIGGVSFDEQLKILDRGADVLIATPGRLLDHFQRGKLLLNGVEILVIDEADRMLDMGFIPDIEKICRLLPPRRQTLFFSATMPPEIQRLVDTFLRDPARIEVAPPATTAKTITQLFRYCASTEDWGKREMLRDLIRSEQVKNAIIFCNRKRDVAILLKSLQKHGFNAGALHGDMDQMSRMDTLAKFRDGTITFLAASDVAARGLDIPDVSHIFNFDVPWQADDYVHRIGRTGRAGKEGRSLTIVTPDDIKQLKDIERMLGAPVTWIGDPPSAEDMASADRRRGRGRRGASRRPEARRDAKRPHDGAQGAPGRKRRPERPAAEAGAVHEQPPAPAHANGRDRPARRARPPREQEHVAHTGQEAAAKPQRQKAPRRPPRQPWEPREPRRQRDRDDRFPTPVGLGDHVPAFLRRTTRTGS
jgi:superfamily II DNA/RNA helicase